MRKMNRKVLSVLLVLVMITGLIPAQVAFAAPTTHTVTYQVLYGTWDNGETANITETVEDGGTPAHVPTGMKPNANSYGGSWNTDPAGAVITEDTTFTYAFTRKRAVTTLISYDVTNSTEEQGGDVVFSGVSELRGTRIQYEYWVGDTLEPLALPDSGYSFKEWRVGTSDGEVMGSTPKLSYKVVEGGQTLYALL